jgi:hypothetical protein
MDASARIVNAKAHEPGNRFVQSRRRLAGFTQA